MKKRNRWIVLTILIAGILIISYPFVSQYYNTKKQKSILSNYETVVSNVSLEEKEEMIEEANNYNKELLNVINPLIYYNRVSGYNETLNLDGSGIMGTITIQKLRINLPIYHGTSSTTLSNAVGHLEGSSLPVGGESTHAVLSAHRGLPTSKLFTDLTKLEIGDTFTINILNETLVYQVDEISIVDPDEMSKLQIIENEDHVTLMTCTPYGINTHRLLVRGTRVDSAVLKVENLTNEAYKVNKVSIILVISISLLIIVTIYILLKPNKRRKYEKSIK